MNEKTFIERLIIAIAISVLILILGMYGLFRVPIGQFPNNRPHTLSVQDSLSVEAIYIGVNGFV